MALAIILLRFAQYGAAAVLFGGPLLLLTNPLGVDAPRGSGRVLAVAALMLTVAAPLQFFCQTALLAGSFSAALDPAALRAALFQMDFGVASLMRAAMAVLAICAILVPWGRLQWRLCALLGAGICASFAWMGHGAATEGPRGWLHLVADIVHLWAASAWIGALVPFALALTTGPRSGLYRALASFSGFGSILVALLVLSGLVNDAFLVGWDIPKALAVPYGRILGVKLTLFALMLLLAAANRWSLTPALGRGQPASSVALRRSIMLEMALGFGVLALVAWLGTMPPVLE